MNGVKLNCEKIISESNHILNTLKNGNQNYIFGCGWMGTKFFETIKHLNIKVSGFVVTNKNVTEFQNLPVYSIDELAQEDGGKNIFVALRDQNIDLNKRLETICEIVYPITYPNHITVIEARYYIDYLQKKNVKCQNEYLHLNRFSLVNPFLDSYDYLLSWVYEAGDLLLPVIYDDYSRIDEGPYETEHTELVCGDVVLDCGANIGLFSSIAIQKGCTVYAFEPMPDAIQYLQRLKEEYVDSLIICPYALADRVGRAKFHVQNFDLLGASLLENNNIIDCDYDVEVITIDEYVRKNKLSKVDYIKADIEGSERDMLLGATETIRKYSPKISICTYHLEDDKEILEKRIKDINPAYVVEHRWKKLYAYVPQ